METQTNLKYLFDPAESRLTIIQNGKPRGGFVGTIAVKKFGELLESGAEINIGGTSDMDIKLKVRQLRALWIKQGIDQYRDSILQRYGVESTTDLTETQLDELIKEFSHTSKTDATHEVSAARSSILKLLQELGVYDNSGDWKRVNEYLMNKRIAGKMLYQMSINEMKSLSIKLRSIIKKNNETTHLTNLN